MYILGELQAAQLERLSAAPTPASTGRIYFDSVLLAPRFYDGTSWRTLVYAAGARTVTGTASVPTSITAAGGITPTSGVNAELIFVQGSPGAVDIGKNPQIAVGTTVGQQLVLVGCSDSLTILLNNGTGLSLNGDCMLVGNSVLGLYWDGTLWQEEYRR